MSLRSFARGAVGACTLLVLGALVAPSPSFGEDLWAVTTFNNLINFDSGNPWVFNSRPITGMQAGEDALGIDFRPAMPVGRLYVLGSSGRVYLVADPGSGVATAVGAMPFAALVGTNFGFDFNPTVDRIRIVTDAEQNLRVHPDTGALVATDLPLAYAAGDPNFGMPPGVTGGAYINNVAGAVTTTLYDIDTDRDVLVTQVPPNNGTLNTVGPLGVDATGVNGFDVSGMTGIAYAALSTGGTQSTLYTVNLTSGGLTSLGVVGCQEPLRGLSVSNDANVGIESRSWGAVKHLYSR
jgi:hypothetical protein